MRAVSLALFALPALAGGCASVADPGEGDPRIEVGTGTWRYEPLEDGDGVPLVFGAQGGWHLWVAVRAYDVDVDFGSLEVVHQPADERLPPSTTRIGVTLDPPDATGGRAYLGWPAILADPACSVGELHRLQVTLTPASGGRLTAERYVRVLGGEHPPPPCGAE
ncbi:MAG: hypothetical protein KF729_29365 [Sandaracinaceae bacterium]|nr:hypothetical protein [Sandaracinaceae bacterium]